MNAADSLLLLLAKARRQLDRLEYPPAPPRLPWAAWCMGRP